MSPPLPSLIPSPIKLPMGAPPVQAAVFFATAPPVIPSPMSTLFPTVLPLISSPCKEDKLASPKLPLPISLAKPRINEESISIKTHIASPKTYQNYHCQSSFSTHFSCCKCKPTPPLKSDAEDPTKTSSIETGTINHAPKATTTGSKVKSGGKVVKMHPSATRNGRQVGHYFSDGSSSYYSTQKQELMHTSLAQEHEIEWHNRKVLHLLWVLRMCSRVKSEGLGFSSYAAPLTQVRAPSFQGLSNDVRRTSGNVQSPMSNAREFWWTFRNKR
ncbi:hypothetical protein C8R48DRAFT_779081 [Suillus tomentosus]|nr:hypothetical protein C8R48DRAFT_779081 [Suillus tomentosus]